MWHFSFIKWSINSCIIIWVDAENNLLNFNIPSWKKFLNNLSIEDSYFKVTLYMKTPAKALYWLRKSWKISQKSQNKRVGFTLIILTQYTGGHLSQRNFPTERNERYANKMERTEIIICLQMILYLAKASTKKQNKAN